MNKWFIYLCSLPILFLCSAGFSQKPELKNFTYKEELNTTNQSLSEGTIVDVVVHSPGLENNLLGDSPNRDVTVYLPPGYEDNPCTYYPVIYLLHGYLGDNRSFYNDQGVDIEEMMNHMIQQDSIIPMIIVTPNSYNKYQGSFYTNSIVTGNWEDFIVEDVVKYVDRIFRTLPQPESRGIAGHSMGGYGTFRLVMRNPAKFHAAYGICSAFLVAEDRMEKFKDHYLEAVEAEEWDGLHWRTQGVIAHAAAVAPDTSATPFMCQLPLTADGQLIDSVWQRHLEHDPYTMLPFYKDSLLKLHAIQFECGALDPMQYDANVIFSQALTANGVDHVFESYEGGHEIKHERMENKVLPFFSDHLADTLVSDSLTPNLLYSHCFEIDENSHLRGRILPDTCYWDVDSMQYQLIYGDGADIFSINNETKEILADSAELDYEKKERYELLVQASYKYDTMEITDTAMIIIKLRNLNDNSPVFHDTTFSIEENSPALTHVGTVGAEDLDGDLLYFEIIDGNTNGTFSISKQLGQIRVANPDSLDYESIPQFNLTIVVRELFGPHADTANLTINIIDVVTSIPTAEDQDFLKIYPNPTNGILYLDVLENSMQISEVEIINITGRTIYHKTESIEQVDVSGFANGLYFVKVRVNGNMYVEKVIIQE